MASRLLGVAKRVVELLVRHMCLLRPIGEAGKMRLTTDMAQVRGQKGRVTGEEVQQGWSERKMHV